MTEPSRQSGSDPIGEFQRWLVRSGARSVTRQLGGQIRTTLGGGKQSSADVWETATTDHDEAPECAWCPICRARRRLREQGPGLGSGVAAAADAVGVVMQDAMSAFEAAVNAAGRPTRPRSSTTQPPGEVWDEVTGEPETPPAPKPRPRPAPKPRPAPGPRPVPGPAAKPAAGPAANDGGPVTPARFDGPAGETGTKPEEPGPADPGQPTG
ncbi:MAG: hypothetical protein ACLPKI_04905 [Streptosporangiaceae bacterium]